MNIWSQIIQINVYTKNRMLKINICVTAKVAVHAYIMSSPLSECQIAKKK